MTKYELFMLIWKGYQQDQSIAIGYSWDDLSGMTYVEMSDYFDLLASGSTLGYKYDDDFYVVYPVII